MYQHDLMKGQRILVTGGGTGLGQAMAEKFLELGADVAICGRRKAVCDATAEAWRAKFPQARIDTFGVDIRVAQAVEEMVEALFADGGLSGLVNNAAGNFISPTEALEPARLRRHCRHRLPRQLLRHAGHRQALGGAGQGRRVDSRASPTAA